MTQHPQWPAWRYGPKGEAAVFESEADVPKDWHDHPSKHEKSASADSAASSEPAKNSSPPKPKPAAKPAPKKPGRKPKPKAAAPLDL